MNKAIHIDAVPPVCLELLRHLEEAGNPLFVAELPEKLRHPDVLGWLMDPEHQGIICFRNGNPGDEADLRGIKRELEGRTREAVSGESAPRTGKGTHFDRYAAERLALAFELGALPLAVARDYREWAIAEGIRGADRMNEAELEAHVVGLPGVSKGLTRITNSVGRRQHGYVGVGLCKLGDKPSDLVERIRSRRIRIMLTPRGASILRDQRLAGPPPGKADVLTAVAPPPWTPPSTHVGANTIINGDEFCKGGKRPPRSTLQNWEEADRRAGVLNDADVLHAPDNGEKYYPRKWVEQRIRQWSPRTTDRKP
ncbi:MAG: hypothetical protein PVJ57_19120 [Phycisphaerae bacterium]|jgi:hypothetical protein